MEFPADDDDDLDLDALRLAALSTLKKTLAPSRSTPTTHNNAAGGPRVKPMGGLHPPQNRGRGRGIMRGGRGGTRGGRGNFTPYHNNNQNFFPIRPSGNSNLITIVPTVPDEPETSKETLRQGPKSNPTFSGSTVADSTLHEEEKVPAKFRRVDDDSESDESDDDTDLKAGSNGESSEEDEEEKEKKSGNTDNESEKDSDPVSAQQHEDEGDTSLERLMQELEDEISDAPKDKKPVLSAKDNSNVEKMPHVKKIKKEKVKTERPDNENNVADDSLTFDKVGGLANQSIPESNEIHQRKPSPTQSRSPLCYDPVSRDPSPESSNIPHKHSSSARPHSPQTSRSPLRYRSPLKSRSPRSRSRSPIQSRSPLRSPRRSPRRSLSRSPRRSPPRSHAATARSPAYVGRRSSRSPLRSPLRSPRRSPLYLPPRASSPGRLPPLRSRSRSPRLVRRSRSRSRSPLGTQRRPASPARRLPPLRRSLSRSPGGRLYMTRRSRSRSPRRSPSPRSRRSPLYVKKLSPKRRSVSPRRRSISPRRRSISPRRRSISPRRRPLSPRRRAGSPSWSRLSPARNRSPVGSFSQRPLSPRRRSPYGDAYPARRSPSPPARKYSPPPVHRGASPQRSYRSPSPVPRSTLRRRSPAPTTGPPRRVSPPSFRLSPAKSSNRAPASPIRVRDKPRQLSPLPSVSRTVQRVPSPRRQRSPVSYSRGHHTSKALSPVRRVSPNAHKLRRSLSPHKDMVAPASGRDTSPNDSISLSPSPERLPQTKSEERNRGRKSHPLGENHVESKRSHSDLRNVLPRRKDVAKESEPNVASRSEELTKKEKKERRRAKREKKEHKRESHQNSSNVLEARRRKFESGGPVEISSKKIRLRNMLSEPADAEEQEIDSTEVEVNIEKEKERELKEASEVDESILDKELMGGVDLLWSDEEEEEEEEEEDDNVETPAPVSNVQFKRTFNMPSGSGSSGKENIPEDSIDSKKDDENPTSTTGSPPGNENGDEDSAEEERYVSDISGDELQPDEEPQDNWPKTNRELKEYIISQAKGTVQARPPKSSRKESSIKRKSNESDDLRAELSRRRAERLTKTNCPEVPERLLQSALQGVGVKPRRDKSHRRRTRSPFEDNLDQQESDGRRVLVLRRAAEQKEPAINITISKVESSKDSSSLKMGGKLPIHMRLGTGKKSDDSPKKVKLKRNITVGRKKQVLCYFNYVLCLLRFMVLLHACGLEQPIISGKFCTHCGLTNKPATSFKDIEYSLFYICLDLHCYF
ncbi:serine/arginine repetitive matrix protein 2-like isoform X2 [Thrips palmi]|nr:serine/arginine repetitive matrix protein 2-like isoform X2 [Thrips palmi]